MKPLRKDIPSYVLEFTHLCAMGCDAELSGDIIHAGLAHCNKEIDMIWISKNEAIEHTNNIGKGHIR